MAFQLLLPTSDARNRNWLHEGAGSTLLFGHVDENPASANDADYIAAQGPWPNSYLWLEFTNPTVAADARIRGVRPIYRVAAHTSGIGEGVYVGARDPVTGKVTVVVESQYSKTAFITTTKGWWTTKPGSGEWTKTVLDRCQMQLYSKGAGGGLKVSAIAFEVETNSRPTVTNLVVTGFASTSRPTLSWDWTQADNYPMREWQARVFKTADTLVSGFDPATSTKAEWDSGVRHGFAEATTLSQDLKNGTYTAYVRAAMEFLGGAWYSTWDNEAFTQGIEPPPRPTLTVTPDTAVPRLRNRLSLQGFLNMLSSDDADFETTIGNWVAGVGAAPTRSTAQFRHGAASMLYTGNGTATPFFTNSGGSGGPGAVVTKAGQTYRFSGFVRAGTTGRAWRIVARQHDAANAFHSQTNGSTVTDSTSWQALPGVTHTAAVEGRLYFQLESTGTPPAAEQHFFDQLQIIPGSADVTWTPGGYTPTDSAHVEYADVTTGDSNWLVPQLASNGLIEQNANGFYPRTADQIAYDPSDAPAALPGQGAILWEPLVGAGGALDIGATDDAFSPTETSPPYLPWAIPGLQMVFSVYVKVSANFTTRISLQPVTEENVAVGSPTVQSNQALTAGQGWVRLSQAITPPAGCCAVRPTLDNVTPTTGVQVRVANLAWQVGAAAAWQPGQGVRPTWVDVRGGPVAPQPTSQLNVLHDEEVPPGRVRLYRGWTFSDTLGGQVSADTPWQATRLDPAILQNAGRCVLKDPYHPESAMAVFLLAGSASEKRTKDSAEFHPLGRSLPLVFTDFIGGLDLGVRIFTMGEAEWAQLERLLSAPNVLYLQDIAGGGRYLAFKEYSAPRTGPAGRIQRETTVDAVEVGRPS